MMSREKLRPIKYSVHKTVTTKQVSPYSSQTPRLVTFSVTDCDATDSSGEDCERENLRRVKKLVNEIRIERHILDLAVTNETHKMGHLAKPLIEDKEKALVKVKKFRGVRQRASGKWSAEIRDPSQRGRVWLGTYDTAEEAALVYDAAAVRIRGPETVTNFSKSSVNVATSFSGYDSGKSSPTSVLMSATNAQLKNAGNAQSEFKDVGKAQSEFRNAGIGNDEVLVKERDLVLHDYLLPLDDECFLKDYFDYRSPPGLVYDDVVPEDSSLMYNEISVIKEGGELDADFGSLTWDVDELLEVDGYLNNQSTSPQE